MMPTGSHQPDAAASSLRASVFQAECRWTGGIDTLLEQYIPSASIFQFVPEEKEAERSTTRRASHLPRRREERKGLKVWKGL